MIKESFKQYSALLAVLLRNITLRPSRRKAVDRAPGKRIGKIGVLILIIVGAAAFVAYEVMVALSLTNSALSAGLTDEPLYTFLMASQFVVLFFGVPTVMGTLYFSGDNPLLSTMPFRKGVVFAAKFTVAYLGELLIACVLIIPTTIATGIAFSMAGVSIPAYFYPTAILAAIMSPAIPLLIITLLALPLMRVITVLKRNKVGYGIVMTLIYCVFIGLYFAVVFGSASMDGEGALSNAAVGLLVMMKKIGVLNYPIVALMTGVKPLINLLILILGYAAAFAAVIALSFIFYEKAVRSTAETGGAGKPREVRNAANNDAPRSLFSAFLFKEFKTLLNTPTLFVNVILSVALPPIMMLLMRYTLANDGMSEAFGGESMDMFLIGIITYVTYILSGTANPIASIGFSREGKNLPFLKSLPISADLLVKVKLLFAMLLSTIFTVAIGIAFPFATGIYDPVAIIGMPLLAAISGFGSNCMMLYNDLKTPNYQWLNINEITKNNKRMLVPMLINVGIGFVYMVLAIVLGVLLGGTMTISAICAIFYAIVLIAPVIISIVYYNRLTANPQQLFDKIGG